LSGTPIQNSLDELWALLNFLHPEQFGSKKDFKDKYGDLRRAEDVASIQETLRPLMVGGFFDLPSGLLLFLTSFCNFTLFLQLRRLKEDVEKTIPIKEETIVEVELTTIQKGYYLAILQKNFAFLTKGANSKHRFRLSHIPACSFFAHPRKFSSLQVGTCPI
jgi:chromodomain helicase DNA binding protein 8/chromodomain-helicase-DNA-binding protein 7